MASKARVDEILAQALEVDAIDRLAFLERACGADNELRAQVEELLEVDSGLVAQFEMPAFEHFGRLAEKDRLGERIGPYVLERVLGAGGTAGVYLGCRVEGVGPEKVAVKLLRGGFDGEEFRRRFASTRPVRPVRPWGSSASPLSCEDVRAVNSTRSMQ